MRQGCNFLSLKMLHAFSANTEYLCIIFRVFAQRMIRLGIKLLLR